MCDFKTRDCYLCGMPAPSEIHDYGTRHRYKCPDCGEYQITTDAKESLAGDEATLRKIVKSGQGSNTYDTILTISLTGIKPERR